jgi:hypothetical protein
LARLAGRHFVRPGSSLHLSISSSRCS